MMVFGSLLPTYMLKSLVSMYHMRLISRFISQGPFQADTHSRRAWYCLLIGHW